MTTTEQAILVEGRDRMIFAMPAHLVEDGHETAWSAPHVTLRDDWGYVQGRYVEADNANRNGHIFGLEGLRANHQTVVHTPLNMLHRSHQVLGTYLAAKLLYPIDGADEMDDQQLAAALETARAVNRPANPYVETLANVWRYAFPGEYRAIKEAHAQGALWQSMEAIPAKLRCPSCPEGHQEYAYAGVQSKETYCAHLNTPGAPRELINPHFIGGGIILPPTRPGWADADVRQVARELIKADPDQAAALYSQVEEMAPQLDPRQWETLMAMLMAGAFGPVPGEPAGRPVAPNMTFTPDPVRARELRRERRPVPPPADEPGVAALWAKEYSTVELEQLLKEGKALPGLHEGDPPRFPIKTEKDLANAIKAFGRHGGADAPVKRHIIKHARRLGRTDMLPDTMKAAATAAAGAVPPATVYQAYSDAIVDFGEDPAPVDELTVSSHAVPDGRVLWMLADGWGEWFVVAGPSGANAACVAQKMPDVAAWYCDPGLEITAADVAKVGLGDAGWVNMLIDKLTAVTSDGQPVGPVAPRLTQTGR